MGRLDARRVPSGCPLITRKRTINEHIHKDIDSLKLADCVEKSRFFLDFAYFGHFSNFLSYCIYWK